MKPNHIAIWLIVVAQWIITILWYSPLLFSKLWNEKLGRDLTTFESNDSLPYITALLATIILNYTLSWLINQFNKQTFVDGFKLGMVVFFGIAAPVLSFHYKYLNISTIVLFIDLGLSFVLITLTSGILAIWKKSED